MNTTQKPRFDTATDEGEIVEKSGYHQPGGRRSIHMQSCGCRMTTEKGAYRDVTVEMDDGRVVHFYHQSPVVVELPDGRYRIDGCGYRTSTTKARINRYIPRGYRVIQRDFEWYVETPDGRIDFRDGMVLDP